MDLGDHTADRWAVLQRRAAVQLVQPEPDQGLALVETAADRAADLFDDDGLVGHGDAPQPSAAAAAASASRRRACRSDTFTPRRAATERGLSSCCSASKVARTMLYGL